VEVNKCLKESLFLTKVSAIKKFSFEWERIYIGGFGKRACVPITVEELYRKFKEMFLNAANRIVEKNK
jgi:hypothetical protein